MPQGACGSYGEDPFCHALESAEIVSATSIDGSHGLERRSWLIDVAGDRSGTVTEHAFDEGKLRSVDDVLTAVQNEGARHVQLTGGEPLLQRAAPLLMTALVDAGYTVLLETSGGVSTERVDPRVVTILDVKTPGSGEHERNVWKNLERLRAHDEVKFVITSADDYTFAKRIVDENALTAKCTVLFSPSFPGLSPVTLAEWMVRDRLDVRFQMQLHKVLWGEKRGV